MKEEFVHAIWKYQLFNKQNLSTVDGKSIEIIQPGFSHANAGPDFISAKIKIDGMLWAGNVELHVKSSEWYQHKHHVDPAYNNVILHVVYTDDASNCYTANELTLHTLELHSYIDDATLNAYEQLRNNLQVLPCKNWWNKIDKPTVESWLIRLCIERLMQKCAHLKQRLHQLNEHWDQLFFEIVARQLGFHVNSDPMEMLAKSIKIEWVQKLSDQDISIDALFFGQAGMLQKKFSDEYPNRLKKEYAYLQKKYNLKPMDVSLWKFLRLRPHNFPTVRIAQLASIFKTHSRFFSEILELSSLDEIEHYFELNLHPYWNNHYRFDKESPATSKQFSEESTDQLLLNTIAMVWLLYGDQKNDLNFKQKSLALMERIKPEKNRYTERFKEVNYPLGSSIQSQGQRFLWEHYCDHKKCLTCSIGIHGLKYS